MDGKPDGTEAYKPQKMTVVLFCVMAAFHALAVLWVLFAGMGLFFKTELYLLIGIQSAAAFLLPIRSPLVRHMSLALRCLMLCVSLLVLEGRLPLVQLLLLLPFIADLSFYFRLRPLILYGVAPLIVAPALNILSMGGTFGRLQAFTLVAVVIISLLVLGGGCLLSCYREELVKVRKNNESLLGWVSNLTASNQAFQDYADSAAMKSEINERNRITRELHDSIGYALSNISMMMRASKVLLERNPADLGEMLDRAREQTDAALVESRKILYGLRDMERPAQYGLKALMHLVSTYSQAMGIKVEFEYGSFPASLGEEIDAAVFRFVQEGLTNAFKHGQADLINIICQRSSKEINVSIIDNGKGSDFGVEGIGISGMRERFAPFAGIVEGKSMERGFVLSVNIPLQGVFNEAT